MNVTDFPQHVMKQVICHTSPCAKHESLQTKQEKHKIYQCGKVLLTAEVKILENFHIMNKIHNFEIGPSSVFIVWVS
jgi:hypothetical protein